MFNTTAVVTFAAQAENAPGKWRQQQRWLQRTDRTRAYCGCYLPVSFFPMLFLLSSCSYFWSEAWLALHSASDSPLCFGQQRNGRSLPRQDIIPSNTAQGRNFCLADRPLKGHCCTLKYGEPRQKGERDLCGRIQNRVVEVGGDNSIPGSTGILESNKVCQIKKVCLSNSILNCRPL